VIQAERVLNAKVSGEPGAMADGSRIEWTDATWNPVTGCRKISAGCRNCYAERMAKRLQAMGKPQYAKGFRPAVHPSVLDRPAKWARPRIIFVNSMSDLFLPEIPFAFVRRVFDVMNECDHHVFQVLTKRPEVAAEYSDRLHWSENIWLGVTVENQDTAFRIAHLRAIPANLRFLSCEPLLTPLRRLPLKGIHWVIAGGESGPGSRPMHPDWVRDIRDKCLGRGVPFFFKQWGGVNKKKAGRILDGRTWDEMPPLVEERLAVA
jgi:protein gp37